MKFQKQGSYSNYYESQHTITNAIINEAFRKGELETLSAKVETLSEMISFFVSRMSEQEATEFAKHFGWVPVKDDV